MLEQRRGYQVADCIVDSRRAREIQSEGWVSPGGDPCGWRWPSWPPRFGRPCASSCTRRTVPTRLFKGWRRQASRPPKWPTVSCPQPRLLERRRRNRSQRWFNLDPSKVINRLFMQRAVSSFGNFASRKVEGGMRNFYGRSLGRNFWSLFRKNRGNKCVRWELYNTIG